jgi:hypothetical protein
MESFFAFRPSGANGGNRIPGRSLLLLLGFPSLARLSVLVVRVVLEVVVLRGLGVAPLSLLLGLAINVLRLK